MLVIARKDGQLGNKLLQFAQFIAVSQETGVPVCNPCFGDYAAFFETTQSDLWCRFPRSQDASLKAGATVPSWKRKLLPRLTHRLMHLWYGMQSLGEGLGWKPRLTRVVRLRPFESIDLGDELALDDIRRRRLWVAMGWRMSSKTLVDKHQNLIREFFRPLSIHLQNIEQVIQETKRDADVVVGVHIRHGDYAHFEGGRFYYPLSDYRRWMDSLVQQYHSQRVTFLVCGNGVIDHEAFEGLSIKRGSGHMVEDMYALARTDLIIGPPSTFSAWASFYGQTPLISLRERNQSIQCPADVVTSLSRAA